MSQPPTIEAAFRDALSALSAESTQLLRALGSAGTPARALALGTAPAPIQAELARHGLARADAQRWSLSALGLAAAELLGPLSERERAELRAQVDAALR